MCIRDRSGTERRGRRHLRLARGRRHRQAVNSPRTGAPVASPCNCLLYTSRARQKASRPSSCAFTSIVAALRTAEGEIPACPHARRNASSIASAHAPRRHPMPATMQGTTRRSGSGAGACARTPAGFPVSPAGTTLPVVSATRTDAPSFAPANGDTTISARARSDAMSTPSGGCPRCV